MESLLPEARARWRDLLASREPGPLFAGLELARERPGREWLQSVLAAEAHPDERVRRAALATLERHAAIAGGALGPWVRSTLRSGGPEERATALRCAVDLPEEERLECAHAALDDPHPLVSAAAVGLLADHHGASFADASLDLLADDSLPLRAQRALLGWLIANSASPRRLAGFAMRRSQEALALAGTLHGIRRSAPAGSAPWSRALLPTAVEERALECADLALLSMQALEDENTVGRVRAAVASGDTRHFARAVEALESLRNREIALALRKTLENVRGDAPLDAPTGTGPETFMQIVDYLSQYPDAFLRECARHGQHAAAQGPA
jgi:hypothetical protein